MKRNAFKLEVGKSGTVSYLYFPDHPRIAGAVAKQVRLSEVYPACKGPDILFDLDQNEKVIGIEVII